MSSPGVWKIERAYGGGRFEQLSTRPDRVDAFNRFITLVHDAVLKRGGLNVPFNTRYRLVSPEGTVDEVRNVDDERRKLLEKRLGVTYSAGKATGGTYSAPGAPGVMGGKVDTVA